MNGDPPTFYRNKKVLVTGGTGFVGTHLVEELLRQGALPRIPIHVRPPIVADDRVETIQADLADWEACRAAARGAQYVFHAAGLMTAAGATAGEAMAAITRNLVLTAQMLQAAWEEGVERFLVFSSSTAYPPADHPVKEEELWSAPPFPGYFGYGWMRRYLERLSEFVARSSPLQIALVRPTAVFGRWDNFDPRRGHVIPSLIRRAVARENPFVVWGTGEEVRDFLHVGDLARGCLLLLEKHATCDPVNIGYGRAAAIKEIVAIILRAAGHSQAEVRYDATQPSALPLRMVDTSKARHLLGFEPQIRLEDGLADTVAWYQNRFQQGSVHLNV